MLRCGEGGETVVEDVADEPWVENATARDLRERLVRVVPMRAGHIAVRYTTGPSTVLGVQARRRRGSIEVRAEELGTPDLVATDSKERWTYPDQLVDADAVFMVLEEALWRLSPPGIGGAVSLRLEQHDEVEAYRNSYAFVWGWLIALFVIVLGTMALGAQSSDGFLGVIARLGGTRVEGFVPFLLVAAVALTAILPAASGAWCVERIADRLDLPYAGREPLEVVGSFLGCAGFVVAVILSGRSWGLVAALPWVVGIAWVVGVPLARRFAGWLRPAG
jgi:hypothetical protein